MKSTSLRTLVAAAAVCLSAAWAPAAQSATATYIFNGDCIDCAEAADTSSYPVSATLVLDNYTPGQIIQTSNFVSFTYGGSNLQPAYTVLNNNVLNLSVVPLMPTFYVTNIAGAIAPTINIDTLFLGFNTFGQILIPIDQISAQTVAFGGGYFHLFTGGEWDTCASADTGCLAPADLGVEGHFITPTVSVPVTAPLGLLLAGGLALAGLRRRR